MCLRVKVCHRSPLSHIAAILKSMLFVCLLLVHCFKATERVKNALYEKLKHQPGFDKLVADALLGQHV